MWRHSTWLALALIFTVTGKSALAQSQNSAAINLDSLYQVALAAEEKGNRMQAVVALERLQVLQPNYRDVVDRLAEAHANLNWVAISGAVTQADNSGDPASFLISGALAALIVFPLAAFLVFSPTSRARFYLWRKDHTVAAQTYERILERHPGRAKHYPTLANIYLLQNRRDERAMQVYKTALQLNLAVNNREKINAIVAQNCLTEGRRDSDAIEALEKKLKAMRCKQIESIH